MRANLTPDVELAARLFDALRAKTFDGVGITREAYGPGEQAAHALVRAEAEALGLDIANDAGREPGGETHRAGQPFGLGRAGRQLRWGSRRAGRYGDGGGHACGGLPTVV